MICVNLHSIVCDGVCMCALERESPDCVCVCDSVCWLKKERETGLIVRCVCACVDASM